MRLGYAGRLRPDRFNFRTSFAPYLRIDLDEPISLVDWWLQWVIPLCDLLEVINGKPLDIMYLLAFEDKDATGSKRRADQVFRYDIRQDCIKIDEKRFNHTRAIVNLKQDNINLLKLIAKRRELEASRHPLIETYRSNAVSDDQHPRSRFLLLIQALEGLYGYEHKGEYQQRSERYAEKREAVLKQVETAISSEDFKFLRKNLLRNPTSGLEGALSATFQTPPGEIQTRIDNSKIVSRTRDIYRKKICPLQSLNERCATASLMVHQRTTLMILRRSVPSSTRLSEQRYFECLNFPRSQRQRMLEL